MAGFTGNPGNRTAIVVVSWRSLCCAVLLICVVLLVSSNRFWRWMYPISYRPAIQQAAVNAHVDPLLIASIIRVESKFRTEEVSHAGAVGLMQLMPTTAQWIATKMAAEGSPMPSVKGQVEYANPAVNIALGAWYVQYLMQRFQGNQVAAVAAYNAGPQRVAAWLGTDAWDGRLVSIVNIPVGETRHFVDRVFYNYSLYKRIYSTNPGWQ